MKTTRLTLLFALLLSACSGLGDLPALQQPAPTLLTFPTLPPTWTPAPTTTPAPPTLTSTPRPSATALPATATVMPLLDGTPASPGVVLPPVLYITPLPASDLPAGWHEIQSETASFWLPESYAVADLGEFGDLMEMMMVAMVQGFGEAFSSMVTAEPGAPTPTPLSLDELRGAFDIDLLLAIDGDTQAAAFLLSEPLEAGTTLESQMAATIDGIEGSAQVQSYEVLIGSRYETARAIVKSWDVETGTQMSQLVYVFLNGKRAYSLSYNTEAARFAELLPIFERSAQSFVAKP